MNSIFDPSLSVSVPKVLLHDHLDGGLRPMTILEIAEEIGWTPRLPSIDPMALHRWFVRGAESKDILKYLATFEHTTAVMQRPKDLVRVAREAVIDLANDGVVYAEVRFAPELHVQRGLALEAVVEAVQEGFRAGMADAASSGQTIEVNTIVCAMRTERRSIEIVNLALAMRARDERIVAFDIAGAETGWPPSLHAEAFAIARANDLHITVHASEPPDLELIAGALEQGAERIGHGVRLQADVDFTTGTLGPLATSILDQQICLEMAPTCNTQIGAVPSVAEHPIGPFLRMGFRVGINTDNRLMSKVSMSSELAAVARAHHLTIDEARRLAVNAMDAAFAPEATRRRMVDDVINPGYRALAAS